MVGLLMAVLMAIVLVTMAVGWPEDSDPSRWLADEDAPYQSPWSLEDWDEDDEREMAGELEYEEEGSTYGE